MMRELQPVRMIFHDVLETGPFDTDTHTHTNQSTIANNTSICMPRIIFAFELNEIHAKYVSSNKNRQTNRAEGNEEKKQQRPTTIKSKKKIDKQQQQQY